MYDEEFLLTVKYIVVLRATDWRNHRIWGYTDREKAISDLKNLRENNTKSHFEIFKLEPLDV